VFAANAHHGVCTNAVGNYVHTNDIFKHRFNIAKKITHTTSSRGLNTFNMALHLTTDTLNCTLHYYNALFFNKELPIETLVLAHKYAPERELAMRSPPEMYFSPTWFAHLFPENAAPLDGGYVLYGNIVNEPVLMYLMLFEHKLMCMIRHRICASIDTTSADITSDLKRMAPSTVPVFGGSDLVMRMMLRNTFYHLTFEEVPKNDDHRLPLVLGKDRARAYEMIQSQLQFPTTAIPKVGECIAAFDYVNGMRFGVVLQHLSPPGEDRQCFNWRSLAFTTAPPDQQPSPPQPASVTAMCGLTRYVGINHFKHLCAEIANGPLTGHAPSEKSEKSETASEKSEKSKTASEKSETASEKSETASEKSETASEKSEKSEKSETASEASDEAEKSKGWWFW
jgi:hypothetical protein